MNTNTDALETAIAVHRDFTPVYDDHEEVVSATAIEAGDLLWLVDANHLVESARMGSSKVIVKIEGKKTELRLDPTAEYTVTRPVETDASKSLRASLRRESRAAARFMGWLSEPEFAKAKITEALASEHPAFRIAEYAEGLIVAQYHHNLAVAAVNAVNEGHAMSFAAFSDDMIERMKEQLIEGHDTPTYSGGFSFGNAERQTMIEARRKIVSDSRWSF